MTDGQDRRYEHDDVLEADATPAELAKQRHCLMCHLTFESAWSGERICPKCKSKSVWREGFR